MISEIISQYFVLFCFVSFFSVFVKGLHDSPVILWLNKFFLFFLPLASAPKGVWSLALTSDEALNKF